MYKDMDPMYKDKVITPNGINIIGSKGAAKDPNRIRIDALGTPDFGMSIAIAEASGVLCRHIGQLVLCDHGLLF